MLNRGRWASTFDTIRRRLLTPVGLRTLDPEHDDYQSVYSGDLRNRDGAYHQGTVWPWLIGPMVDVWLKVAPAERTEIRRYLRKFLKAHLGEVCVGSVGEIFDAEPPFRPRGCIAQAWSVAETLRAWVATENAQGG